MLFIGTMVGSPIVGWFSDKIQMRRPPMLIGAIVSLALTCAVIFTHNLSFCTLFWLFLGIGFFIIQIILSTIWLKYFNYGPLEWLWRSATYRKWQPMRKRNPGSA